MKQLTTAEEQLMHLLWETGKTSVKTLLAAYPDPKPAYNTVSTIVRILEQKGFVGHEAIGKTHLYYPLIDKANYSAQAANQLVKRFYAGSVSNLVSHFVQAEKMDSKEVDELLALLENIKKSEK